MICSASFDHQIYCRSVLFVWWYPCQPFFKYYYLCEHDLQQRQQLRRHRVTICLLYALETDIMVTGGYVLRVPSSSIQPYNYCLSAQSICIEWLILIPASRSPDAHALSLHTQNGCIRVNVQQLLTNLVEKLAIEATFGCLGIFFYERRRQID